MEPPGWLVRRVRGLAGLEPVSWRHVTGRGYTPSERWVVTFDDGTTGFAKGGTEANSDVAEWLRIEAEIYRRVSGAFLPRLLGWADEGGNEAVLLLEDLSHAVWSPPWTPVRIDGVLAALDAIHASAPPPTVGSLQDDRDSFQGWHHVAGDPSG